MGHATTRTRENWTITIDFRDEATYSRLLVDGKAFVEWVLAFVMTLGFQLKHDEFIALRAALPIELRPVVTFAYYTGWRKQEILGLTWDRVDLYANAVRLDPGTESRRPNRLSGWCSA